nr:hypothetical protein [Bacteroidota bacterium]
MDLQTRKLNIIEYLIGLNDEDIFQHIENIIDKSKASPQIKKINKFTNQELIERAKKSNEDYLLGKFTDQEHLEAASKKW